MRLSLMLLGITVVAPSLPPLSAAAKLLRRSFPLDFSAPWQLAHLALRMGSTTSSNTLALGSVAFASAVPPPDGFASAGFAAAGAGVGAGAAGFGVAATAAAAGAGEGAAATTFALSASVQPVLIVRPGRFALSASAAGRVTLVCQT